MIKSFLLLVLSIAVVCLSFLLFKSTNKVEPIKPAQEVINSNVIIELSKTTAVVNQKEITINAFENSEFPGPTILSVSKYPGLFENDFIVVDDLNDVINNKYFVLVSSNSQRSGSYQAKYFIVVDPQSGNIVYESPTEFSTAYDQSYKFIDKSVIHLNMQVYNLYSDCSNCRLSIDEYVSFDPKMGKFVSVNDRYKSFFMNKLKAYESMEIKEKCVYKGQEFVISDLATKYGDYASCAGDIIYPNSPKFMTMGEYSEFKEKINQLIKGKMNSLVKY